MIPKGMATMLKAMGIDAEKIKSEFETAAETFKGFISNLNSRADKIDARLARIEKHLGIPDNNVVQIEHERKVDHG